MLAALACSAPRSVSDAVASLGRTEDVRFSPSCRRLVVAAFLLDRLAVFDVEITTAREVPHVALTGGVQVSSSALRWPHGVDFLDEDTVIVTNRAGDVSLLALPSGDPAVSTRAVAPVARWPADASTGLDAPGSVTVLRGEEGRCEVLICNNSGHTVTRHVVDRHVLASSQVLLQQRLAVPDGVCVSPDRRWIAVSNHTTHNVLLFENTPALDARSEPEGILRRVYYPHGLRFTPDGRYLFVADAGAPVLHIYAQGAEQWRGVHAPLATVTIMDEATFHRGRHNPQEGGPKGIDIHPRANLLVVTSESQPLGFFDVPTLLDHASTAAAASTETGSLELRHELAMMQELRDLTAAAADARALQNSVSWRITAPLRWVRAAFRRGMPSS
jgi:DNA-binding beta-propeller fold protein YncE